MAGGPAELGKVHGAEIGQFMLFAVAPDVFHWIKLRRVSRQKLQFNLAPRRPGSDPVRPLTQTTFVHKDYGSTLPERFFLISGQRLRFQRWIAGSLRWVARPTGRWQLQPSERSMRQT